MIHKRRMKIMMKDIGKVDSQHLIGIDFEDEEIVNWCLNICLLDNGIIDYIVLESSQSPFQFFL